MQQKSKALKCRPKSRLSDAALVIEAINQPEIEKLHFRHYHEFDTYFLFDDPRQGTVRYREDEFIDEQGSISKMRYRLTLIGPASEDQFPSDVLLSRSRFLAPATHSLRFYREYFKPNSEIAIEKDRLRWRVLFHGTEFFINLDRVDHPALGYFLEVKSRTWSRRDAEYKAQVIPQLVRSLCASPEKATRLDYLEMVMAEKSESNLPQPIPRQNDIIRMIFGKITLNYIIAEKNLVTQFFRKLFNPSSKNKVEENPLPTSPVESSEVFVDSLEFRNELPVEDTVKLEKKSSP